MAAKPQPTVLPTVKEQAIAMMEQFPDDMTWQDAVHEFEIAAAIADGLAESERGEFASDEKIAALFAEAGVKR